MHNPGFCEHGWSLLSSGCPSCHFKRMVGDQLNELRRRLQALEQNTTPARPAEQKPREWLILPRAARDSAECVIAGRSYDSTLVNAGYIHVREVL